MINVSQLAVWSSPISNQPGGLVSKIENLVLKGDLDLEFLAAHRLTDRSGAGVLYVSPIKGERQEAIAAREGFTRNDEVYCLKVTGDDEPGIVYRLLTSLAAAGINLLAVSAMATRGEFALYVAFDQRKDADLATGILSRPV